MHIRIALSLALFAALSLAASLASAQSAVTRFNPNVSKFSSAATAASNPSSPAPAGKSVQFRNRFLSSRIIQAVALNQAVLAFAQSRLGQQVDRGECWDLANRALIHAGAKPANGYVFGTVVTSAMPGDIIQFYNARFESGGSWNQLGSPHHTAIVESVSGSTITMLHQNVNGVRTVSRMTLNLATKTAGSYTFYRPTK